MGNIADEKLVLAAKSGDQGAYVKLVERHYRCVFAVCMGVFGNVHDAEDAAQETIVKGLEKIDSLQDDKQFKCWITRIAKNYCFDVFRQRKRQKQLAEDKADLVESDNRKKDCPFDMTEALEKLPAELRLPLVMFYFENKSAKEIAALLDISHSGVCLKLRKARQRLHELLVDGGQHNEC